MISTKHAYLFLFLVMGLSQSGLSQIYNPSLKILTSPTSIVKDGFVEYNTTNAAVNDARFTLFGDGFFDRQNKFDHQFPKNTSGYTTKTHFLQRYKKKGPIIRSKATGATGGGTNINSKISMPSGANSRVGISWSPSQNIENYFLLIFENTTNAVDSGCVEFYYDDDQLSLNFAGILDYGWVTYVSKTAVVGSSLYNQVLKWEYDNLQPGEQRIVYIPMTSLVGTGVILNVGSKYSSECAGKADISNFSYTSKGYPHDPNKKTANNDCLIPSHPDQQTVVYKIQFQNEGTAPAVDVILKDYLDASLLDLSTLKFIDSEYAYTYTVTGNLLEITFENIHLPGLKQNGPKSYSYDETESFIKFKICTHTYLPGGNLENQAEIIFDTQPPIFTNIESVPITFECMDSVVQCTNAGKPLKTENPLTQDIVIIPNPADNLLFIQGLNTQEVSATIFNNQGERIRSISKVTIENNGIDITDLPKGVYFVQIRNEFLNITEKVIKI